MSWSGPPEKSREFLQRPTAGWEHLQLHTNVRKREEGHAAAVCRASVRATLWGEDTRHGRAEQSASETGGPLFGGGRRVRPRLRAAQGKEPQALPRHCSVQLGVEGKARTTHH